MLLCVQDMAKKQSSQTKVHMSDLGKHSFIYEFITTFKHTDDKICIPKRDAMRAVSCFKYEILTAFFSN